MGNINAYLTFNGNCREAMTFYQDCLGGDLHLQTVGESPMSPEMPESMKHCILHATLQNGSIVLMGSDMVGSEGIQKGNTISLMLNGFSEKHIHECYRKLSAGGKQVHQIAPTFWGALFGDLVDKFGNHWLLNFNKP